MDRDDWILTLTRVLLAALLMATTLVFAAEAWTCEKAVAEASLRAVNPHSDCIPMEAPRFE